MRLIEGDSLSKVCFSQKSLNVVMSDNSTELWALWRERQWLLGFIYQLFGGMGGVFVCGGNRSAHSPPSPSPSPSPPPPSSLLLLLPWPLSDHCCCACRPESSRVLLEGRCVQDARSSLSAVKGNPTEVGWAPRFSGRAQIAPRGEEKLAAALRKDAPGHVLPPDSFSYSLATSDLFSTFS